MMNFNYNQTLSPGFDFNDLSLSDLIEARDLFHVHLMNKKNVIATAISRYRIRKKEPPPTDSGYESAVRSKNKPKRTLSSSEIRPNSWPCILVFVKEWIDEADLKNLDNLTDIIPRNIYMPDGRIVPICVVEASKDDHIEEYVDPSQIIFPNNLIGGGFPLVIHSQGVERIASIGCVVSDGNKYYALTNRHVIGEPGTIIYTKLKGVLTPIGKSTDKQLGNLSFSSVYPGWKSQNLFINMDVGLIEIDDIRAWKTDVFGLGNYGKLADLNIHNFSLNLINQPVAAFGSVSGKLEGEIVALFYRYKSVGGYEYASDFIIGPRSKEGKENLLTRNGDSGTLWLLETKTNEEEKVLMPIALQWGQHRFFEPEIKGRSAYALATCLSNVLRTLEVDLVRDWNLDNDYSWGKLGHFSIATLACGLVKSRKLKTLLKNNLELITFGYDELTIKEIDKGLKLLKEQRNFAPLADVPDLVWKMKIAGVYRGKESPNHFADMDKPDSSGKTLLQRCKGSYKQMTNLTPQDWLSYYNDEEVQDKSKGLLPFRVWQIFNAMETYVSEGDVIRFITAAGILAHYVGDACQPLHISYMFDGIPGSNGAKKGAHVHSIYETTMINKFIEPIMARANKYIAEENKFSKLLDIDKGKHAAGATVQLMKETFKLVPPKTLVDIVIKHKDKGKLGDAAVSEKLWAKVGENSTGETFANGAYYLASLWECAWRNGKGNSNISELQAVDIDTVVEIYQDKSFLPSVNLKEIHQHIDLEVE